MIKTFRDMHIFRVCKESKESVEAKVSAITYNTETKILSFNCWGHDRYSSENYSEDTWRPYILHDNYNLIEKTQMGVNSIRVDKPSIILSLGDGFLGSWSSTSDIQTLDLTEPNTLPSISTTKWDFTASDNLQSFIAPQTCKYRLEVWACSGGGLGGGKGGYSYGDITLTKGETLYINVGKYDNSFSGKSTDIKRKGKERVNRILVAGGGGYGGGKSQYPHGGYGGGLVGGDGEEYIDQIKGDMEFFYKAKGGGGATQINNGTDGTGSRSDRYNNIIPDTFTLTYGSGGDGYYSGGHGCFLRITDKNDRLVLDCCSATGGGSGYVGGVENGQTIGGNQEFLAPNGTKEIGHSGDGFARITMLNSNPLIDGKDVDLGDKNTGFTIAYQVEDKDNDSLIITEKLNGNVLRTLNNAPKGQDIVISITSEQLYELPLNQKNIITIECNDGKGGISYRNYTFRITNTAPIITNTDKNLGVITAIGEKYIVNDIESNVVTIVEKLDNTSLRTYAAVLGAEYTTIIDKDTWIKLKNGQHTYSIEATDSNNSKSTRVFSFTKKETKIDFTLAKPFQTDIKASKILVTPSWELNGATAKVEVCNNAFDANPTWEDITKQVLINRHYNFTNTAKTADKWGVNIRIYIEKDQASLAEVSIKGFGGAFE